ncbi:MAG: hypothetical protein KDD61_10640 [Bdellovibrionales bacterium]|nr:hypothetical protein [Bdellovibrionales bacterium]
MKFKNQEKGLPSMPIKIFVLLLLSLTLSARSLEIQVFRGGTNSGGTVVGNGGGFAEMQTLYIDSLLPVYLEPFPSFDKFRQHILFNLRQPFRFSQHCYTLNTATVQQNPYSIPSCTLYTTSSTTEHQWPRSISELAALVFAYRWLQHDNQSDWNSTYNLGLQLFTNLKLLQRSYPINLKSSLVALFHTWSFHSPKLGSTSAQYTLEMTQNSIDLTDVVANTFKCSQAPLIQWSYFSLNGYNEKQIWVQGPVVWQCQNQRYKADFHLIVDSQKLTVQGQLSQVTTIP